MNQRLLTRSLYSVSDNRKSKIQNQKFALVVGALLLALSLPAEARQGKKVPTIGYLTTTANVEAFRAGLKELGYIEGKNIVIEYRWAEGNVNRLRELAAELVRLNVDVIVVGGSSTVLAAKQATSSIPIVMTQAGDPVAVGVVASLARPGGNVTGLTSLSPDLSGKRLEVLTETVPRLSRVAVLWNPTDPGNVRNLKETQAAAQALKLQVQSLEVRSLTDLDNAFESAKREAARALIATRNGLITGNRKRIAELAVKGRLPTMLPGAEFAEAGGLMSYAPNFAENHRRAATYVDKILKGAKPADLPVEQPTKFEFIINLKTAKQIGLTIPPNVLGRADKVIR
jgi:putative ABC transport system substrate-binding protein